MKHKQLIELKWGETPFDNLSKEELRLELLRYQSALATAAGILITMQMQQGDTPFWSKEGRGGVAMEKVRQLNERLEAFSQDSFYHAFARYADDLLFEQNGFENMGVGWVVCTACDDMSGRRLQAESSVGKSCWKPDCTGTYRLLTWEDLKPEEASDATPHEVEMGELVKQVWEQKYAIPGRSFEQAKAEIYAQFNEAFSRLADDPAAPEVDATCKAGDK